MEDKGVTFRYESLVSVLMHRRLDYQRRSQTKQKKKKKKMEQHCKPNLLQRSEERKEKESAGAVTEEVSES